MDHLSTPTKKDGIESLLLLINRVRILPTS